MREKWTLSATRPPEPWFVHVDPWLAALVITVTTALGATVGYLVGDRSVVTGLTLGLAAAFTAVTTVFFTVVYPRHRGVLLSTIVRVLTTAAFAILAVNMASQGRIHHPTHIVVLFAVSGALYGWSFAALQIHRTASSAEQRAAQSPAEPAPRHSSQSTGTAKTDPKSTADRRRQEHKRQRTNRRTNRRH